MRVTMVCLSFLCLILLSAEAIQSPDEVIHESMSENPFAAEAVEASSYLAKTHTSGTSG